MLRLRLALAGVLLVLLTAGASASPATATTTRPHAAGLVIRHGDGRTLYLFVPFDGDEISGEELLQRAGVALVVAPFGSLGLAVCNLDHEGCPASDCFCQSRGTPSNFWRYQRLGPDGRWITNPIGPGSRELHDGDVDGWVWGSESASLPDTSIDAIYRLSLPVTPVTPSESEPSSPAAAAAVATSDASTANATPVVQGVEVSPNGQASPLAPSQRGGSRFPVPSVIVLAVLAGLVLLLAIRVRHTRAGSS